MESMSTIHAFTEKMQELLAIERDAELEESANLLSRFSLKVISKFSNEYRNLKRET